MKIKHEYKKYINLGISSFVSKQIGRTFSNPDPIVKEVARISNIDIESYLLDPFFSGDKILFFTALLIANHPKFNEFIQEIRKDIIANKLLKYSKKYDEESEGYINTTLYKLENPIKEKLNNSLNLFFAGIGKNLSKQDWTDSISTYILTDILPLPFMPRDTFKINKNQNEIEIKESIQYPVIVIKKRITRRELNQLFEFIEDNGYALEKATQHLPSEPVKRFDVDITKLAIGLFIYRNQNLGNKWIEDFINSKNDENEKYFGIYSESLGKTDFPNFKSDSLGYLDQLYPL